MADAAPDTTTPAPAIAPAPPAPESDPAAPAGLTTEQVTDAVRAALNDKPEVPADPASVPPPDELGAAIKALQAQVADLTKQVADSEKQVADVKAAALDEALTRAGGFHKPEYRTLVPKGIDATTEQGKADLAAWIWDNGALFKGKAPALPAVDVAAPYVNPLYAPKQSGGLVEQVKAALGWS